MSTELAVLFSTLISSGLAILTLFINKRLNRQSTDVSDASELSKAAMELVDRLENRLGHQEVRLKLLENDVEQKAGKIREYEARIAFLEKENRELHMENDRLKEDLDNIKRSR